MDTKISRLKQKPIRTGLGALLVAMLCSEPILAENQAGQNSMSHQTSAQERRERSDRSMAHIRATVVETKRVKFKNAKEEHLLAKVRIDRGARGSQHTTVVDLGPVGALSKQNVNLKTGEEIRARGREGRINRQPVLFIYAFDLGKSNSGSDSRRAQLSQGKGQSRIIEGEITDVTDVNVKNIKDDQRLVKLATDEGQSFIVNLGSKNDSGGMSLQKGDKAVVEGRGGKINGKNVIFADQVAKFEPVNQQPSQSS